MIFRLKRKTFTWNKDEGGTWRFKPEHRDITFLPKEEKKPLFSFGGKKKEEPRQSIREEEYEEPESVRNNYEEDEYDYKPSRNHDNDEDFEGLFDSDRGEDGLGDAEDNSRDLINYDEDERR